MVPINDVNISNMKNKQRELSKKVLFLTKTILTFLVISLLIFINFIELKENNSNRVYLNMLKDIAGKDARSELAFKNYELSRKDMLKTVSPDVFQKHVNSRIALVNTLNTYGALITSASKGSEVSENIIILMTNDSLASKINRSKRNFFELEENERSERNFFYEVQNINQAIDTYNKYSSEEKVNLITGIDTIAVRQKCDSILNRKKKQRTSISTRNDTLTNNIAMDSAQKQRTSTEYDDEDIKQHDRGDGTDGTLLNSETGQKVAVTEKTELFDTQQTFEGLFILNDTVFLSIIDEPHEHLHKNVGSNRVHQRDGHGGDGNQGNSGERYLIKIPIKTTKVAFPSRLFFARYPPALIKELGDKDKQEELRNLYGNAELSMINDISIDIYNKNNEPISIIGFDLSRKWFPIAILFIQTIISLVVYNSTKKSRTLSLLIITQANYDDVLSYIVESKFIRFSLWVLTPPLMFALVLYSSFIHYSSAVYLGLSLCCITSVILGVMSYISSLKL